MQKCSICKKEFKLKGKQMLSHEKACKHLNSVKNEIIDLYVNQLFSINDLRKKFKIHSETIRKLLADKIRNQSDARRVSIIKYPFKHTEESKQKLREKRLLFMKNNPEQTAWRKKNLSYPERLFLDKITLENWGEKYRIEREWSVFPFFIDFAFLNEKVAVEIDGSQHQLEERKNQDEKKDKHLKENGWVVVRVTESEVKKNLNTFLFELEKILNSADKKENYSFGIFSKKEKKQRIRKTYFCPCGNIIKSKDRICCTCAKLKQRKVFRPSLEILIKEIKELGYVGTGKKYGVSDNAIRKWIRSYGENPPKIFKKQ
jgi:very-short-patch-repair endonuclease